MKITQGLLLILLFGACHQNASENQKSVTQLAPVNALEKLEEAPLTDSVPIQLQPSSSHNNNPAPKADWDKKIIRTADIEMEVKEFNDYSSYMREKIRNSGGYLANESQTSSDYQVEDQATIKVPVDQFEHLLEELQLQAVKITRKTIKSSDVSAEFYDLKSRLESRNRVRIQYLHLLTQAKNIEEILQVQQEINSAQEEIEAAHGRINYLTHSARFSTINLHYFQVLNPTLPRDKAPGFGTQMISSIVAGAQWAGSLILILATLWPVWLLLIAGWWIYRGKTRNKSLIQAKENA